MTAVTITQITPPELELLLESSIRKVLGSQKMEQERVPDLWFDMHGLMNYLPDKPAKATIYGWVHSNLIPYHKGQKKLRFLKSEIDDWMKQGRRKTLSEIAHEAEQYLTKKKGGNNG